MFERDPFGRGRHARRWFERPGGPEGRRGRFGGGGERRGAGPEGPPHGPFRGPPPFRFGPRGGPPFDRPFGRRGPFGGDPFDQDEGGRRRSRRGDLKYALLALLAEQPRHGYELIKALEERYAGFYRPSPGSVYPTLQLLEDEGNVTSESVEGKRVYTITEAGRHLLEEHRQRAGEQPGAGPGGDVHGELAALRHSAMALQESVMHIARHGTSEQRRAVRERLDAARRELYRILAQDDADSTV